MALIGALAESDPDQAMAQGALAVPYVQGANHIRLLSALAWLRGWTLGLVWATSWLAALPVFWGERVIPLEALWAGLVWQARRATPEVKNAQ